MFHVKPVDAQKFVLDEMFFEPSHMLSFSYQRAKRLLDVCGALVGLCILVVLLPFIAFCILLEDHGPIFYKQVRVGQNGKPFCLYKIRSMVKDAETYLRDHPNLLVAWQDSGKLQDDPRVTRIGKFLRKTSLDELPQMLNILCGEMSLVGPRAIQFSEVSLFAELSQLRLLVKPGLTGLWQVSGRSKTDYIQRCVLDCTYVMECSFVMDLYILYKTVPVVLGGYGAY